MLGSAQAADRSLTLAFIPQENPEKLIGDIRHITGYLAGEMDRPVRGFVTQDHAAAIEALSAEKADISFMGALPYVMAREQNGARAILSEVYRGKPFYAAAIFVRRNSGIHTIEALRGKTIAFADPVSESGYLYPRDIFARAKLLGRSDDMHGFFRRVYFAGGYQQAIQAVANGLVDAAGVSIYAPMLLPANQQTDTLSIAQSPPIPSHAVIVRKDLDPATIEAFVKAMLKLNQPSHRHLLKHVYSPDGYVRAAPDAYEGVATLARQYGLIR
jgi:phosphonate transport system substrate-binding protein